ncbi:TOMM precursor leader peptide-binding protein [Dictyobacter aurantiacus]|uniref:YcaO domain-containing protein n=1 Tax=Dictyobacter aurantiacus TaxID=1936993 RepID=A0A401ZMC8_9CHLR|nr:TOMM precursor leader peptide-binding protein [Dictyobacter aurantiacus]GCE08029.1 hypothetical protein KDAU_53580 [Dictyobacter aurantiacus]
MRPKFQSDTCYIPFQDGIYLRNNHGGLMLKGKSLYGLLQHLIPILDGGASVEEITDGLNADQRQMIVNLIEKLSAHHFLRNTEQDQPLSVPLSERDAYAPDLAFIASFQENAARSLMRFLGQRLLLIGSGLCFSALVDASLQQGIRYIGVDATAPTMRHAKSAPEQTIREVDALPWDDEAALRHLIQDFDAVLYVSDQPVLARARLLNRLCRHQQRVLMQAIVIDNHVWIGPLVHPAAKGCWECAWRRLQSNLISLSDQLPRYAFEAQPADPVEPPCVTRSTAGLIANRLLFELFRYCTRIGDAQEDTPIIDLDLATFQSQSLAFQPHPLCQADQAPVAATTPQFLDRLRSLQCRPAIDAEEFFNSIMPCTDERLGLFTLTSAENFVQMPLTVFQVNVSNPMLLEHLREPLMITAADLDATASGLYASRTACERYLAEIVDQRRLLTTKQARQQAEPMIAPDRFIDPAPLAQADELWTWAFNLYSARACLVPAPQVFYALHQREREIALPRGTASGMDWYEAACHGLLDWCHHLTIEQLTASAQPYPRVDLSHTALSATGTHLARLLEIADVQLEIYNVTGPLGVPTFAFCVDDRIIAYSTHCEATQALQVGMQRVLQHYQSIQYQQPAYAVTPPIDLPRNLRGQQVSIPDYPCPAAWSDRLTWLLQKLRSHHLYACVVPLDHDPALAEIFPFVVRVLLIRSEV